MRPIIRVRGLGKEYTLGTRTGGTTFREALTGVAAGPLRWLRAGGARPPRRERTIWALRDVSFDVMPGEVVGVIGRNGAGKSTLLKVLSQITEPTTGEVDLYGRVGSLLEVGTGFHPELTGRENIYLNGAILGMRRAEVGKNFDDIVAFAEVEQFLDTPVKRYSSGMYMRLAFAVAAHLEPEILVVDEVLAVGDAAFQKKCLGRIGDVARNGRTVLFVSHNMNAVQELCTTTLLFESGQLRLMSGDVRAVTQEYLFPACGRSLPSEWTNAAQTHDNPWFFPRRFAICNELGAVLPMPVANDEPVWIQLEGEVTVVDPALTIGYAIYAETGELLYWSYQTDAAEGRWPVLRPGRVVLRSPLPRRLLNEGTYRLELIGGLHCRQWLFQPGMNAPSITLTIQGGLSESPLWMARRPGLLAPLLEWRSVPCGG